MVLSHNLFRFAPNELSHSAFWAWVLEATSPSCPDGLSDVKSLGLSLLSELGISGPLHSINVQTERHLSKRDRADICVLIDGHRQVIFEHKVQAIPDAKQLSRYRKALGVEPELVLLSMAFDLDVHPKVKGQLGWKYLGAEQTLHLIQRVPLTHPVVVDYRDWLADLVQERSRLREAALSDDAQLRTEALRTDIGQWQLMKSLTDGIDGEQTRGTNLNGQPWTQFWFEEGSDTTDGLFYRIDVGARGPYLSFRQYQSEPKPSIVEKMARRDTLRSIWKDVLGEGLNDARPSSKGVKESEVGVILLDQNPPPELLQRFGPIHKRLLARLSQRERGQLEQP